MMIMEDVQGGQQKEEKKRFEARNKQVKVKEVRSG